MKSDNRFFSILTFLILGLIALAVVIGIVSAYRPIINENARRRHDIYLKESQIREQTNLTAQLQAQIFALTNDPGTIERLAREKLGYAKTDETVIHFDPATNSPTRQ